MKIEIQYSECKNCRVWIGVVTEWQAGESPSLRWGRQIDWGAGSLGAEVDANEGDLVIYGKKHLHNKSRSVSRWVVVLAGGEVEELSESEARQRWQARQAPLGKVGQKAKDAAAAVLKAIAAADLQAFDVARKELCEIGRVEIEAATQAKQREAAYV